MGLTCRLHFSSNSHNYIWEKYKENNEDWTRKLQRTLGKERSFLTYGIEMHSRLSLALLCTLPHSTRFASSSNCMVL